jgi:signal transduction histidine kinase
VAANLRFSSGPLLRLVVFALLLGAAYYQAARLGLGFRFQNSQIGVVWPANALWLAALLLTPRRRWWAVLTAIGVSHILVMQGVVPMWRWSWQLITNGLFVVGTAHLLARYAGQPLNLGKQRQVLVFMLIVFLTSTCFAFTTPTFIGSVMGVEVVGPLSAVLRTTMSNATAMLMLTPVALLWIQGQRRKPNEIAHRRYLEATAIVITLAIACWLGLATGPGFARNPSLLLLVFPPVLWGAVRFGPKGAVTSLLLVSATSIWATAQQLGPFVLMTDAYAVLSLQLFWLVLCVPVMLLAAVIHEREQAEEELHEQRIQLAHVTRVATVGTLSGALAHELGQPLTAILVNAEAALRMLDDRPLDLPELRGALEDISHQDRQATQIIKHLRAMLNKGDGHFRNVDVESTVREALAIGHSTMRLARIEAHTRIAPHLPPVHGDAVQLLQVVVNLIMNSCEAMSGRGINDRRLYLHVVQVDRRVEITIADTGVGLPRNHESTVFEPFYTTKKQGLGLGLAISQSIVAAHGGHLWAENNREGGATFRLSLPAVR